MKNLREWYRNANSKLFSILRSEKGQTLVEYALLLVMIALVIVVMLKGTGLQVNTVFSKINSGLGSP